MFRVLSIVVFVAFYAIYFTKMYIQRKQGIKTRQIGKRKEKSIHTVEILMSIATLSAPLAQVISIVLNMSWLSDSLRMLGFVIGMIGDVIFLLAVVTMKNSWRAGIPETDETELIQNEIYRWSRNPAFLGFDLMYIGICLLFFNFATISMSVFAIVMLHCQILQEEKYLTQYFGNSYVEYKRKVFRYIGRIKYIGRG